MTSQPALTAFLGGVLPRLGRRLRTTIRGLPGAGRSGSLRRDPRTPEIDLIDRGDAFVVLADLPGFDTADLSVTVSDGTLTLEAVSEATGHRSGRYLKQEREGSTMRRTVSLPEPVDADTVTTAYRRGVVQVVVEKTVAETPDAVQRN